MPVDSDYDDYGDFPDYDDEFYKACEVIESRHTSPVKEKSKNFGYEEAFSSFKFKDHSSRQPKDSKTSAATPFFSSFNPQTPSKKSVKSATNPHTPTNPASEVRRRIEAFQFNSPNSPTPSKPSARPKTTESKTQRHTYVRVGDSDVETTDVESDELEVENSLLVDTGDESPPIRAPPLTAQSSISSLGSGFESLDNFDDLSSSYSSFGLKSPTAGGSQGSPRKFRKLSPTSSITRTSSNASSSSNPRLLAIDDVFGSSSSIPRNNGWRTAPKSPTPIPATPPEDEDTILNAFIAAPLGEGLTSEIICHNEKIVKLMDKHKVAWGVQWELARGVTDHRWSWEDIEEKIPLLHGSNNEIAHRVSTIMKGKEPKASYNAVWPELDREQDAIMENEGRGLGLRGLWGGEDHWYGGKIQQVAHLVIERSGKYKISLQRMEKNRSYRLARFLGSRRILQVKLPKDLVKKESDSLRKYFPHKFVLCGRVFVPLFSKDCAVYMIEINENFGRETCNWCGDQFRLDFNEVIKWQNPLLYNRDQPITKWVTRFSLAFSTSVPVLEFLEQDITLIPDKIRAWKGTGKPPADYIMTDGCGFINEAALKVIGRFLNLASYPSAVQGRVFGAKGLWILHPSDTSAQPKIWIRHSQRKIVYESPIHRAHLIFDLLKTSKASPPVRLSPQSLLNLSENGVPDTVLVEVMRQALLDEVEPLMRWGGPQAMQLLYSVVDRLGHVSRTRLIKLTGGLSRALGLTGQDWGDDSIAVEKEDENGQPSANDEAAAEQGRGSTSLAESIMEMLQAGFHPTESQFLRDKIRWLVTTTLKTIVDKFSIPVHDALNAFIVPDPLGVLKDGEVYYRSSEPVLRREEQSFFSVLTGDVLLGRYPVRLSSDIQKVKAVDHPKLARYVDVLVVSTKGKMSFASTFSGGDYDGDLMFMLFMPSLLEHFRNRDLRTNPPDLMGKYFMEQPERVAKFAHRSSTMSSPQGAFINKLLLELENPPYGMYSVFHDFSIWKNGYEHPETERLAFIFNILLDSSKNGHRLKEGVFEADRKTYGNAKIPELKSSDTDRSWIFHSLRQAGKEAGDELLARYDAELMASNRGELACDKLLGSPYTTAIDRALSDFDDRGDPWNHEYGCKTHADLKRIRDHVELAFSEYRNANCNLVHEAQSPAPPKTPGKRKKAQSQKSNPHARAQELYDQPIEGIRYFRKIDIDQLKGSYAYHRNPKFAFAIASQDLYLIKALASSERIAPTVYSFGQAMTIPSTYVRAINRISAPNL